MTKLWLECRRGEHVADNRDFIFWRTEPVWNENVEHWDGDSCDRRYCCDDYLRFLFGDEFVDGLEAGELAEIDYAHVETWEMR